MMTLEEIEALCPTEPSDPMKIHVKRRHGFWWAWLPVQAGWTFHKKSSVIFNRVARALGRKGSCENVLIFGKGNYERGAK